MTISAHDRSIAPDGRTRCRRGGPAACIASFHALAGLPAAREPSDFFDLENPVDLQRLSALMMTLEKLSGLVVLDEVQRRPELFQFLSGRCGWFTLERRRTKWMSRSPSLRLPTFRGLWTSWEDQSAAGGARSPLPDHCSATVHIPT